MPNRDTQYFLLLNAGHFLDHYFMLIFATVAALALTPQWLMNYSELILYGTPGFAAFALCAFPAGWLADRWSRDGMMSIFFIGVGVSSILTGMAQSPTQIGLGLFLIGVFGSIYHPVGLAIVTTRWKKTGMRLAVNGIWGNFGVGCAALFTGFLIDSVGWRVAFVAPGLFSICLIWPYLRIARDLKKLDVNSDQKFAPQSRTSTTPMWRTIVFIFLAAALGSVVFQSTTFALPEIFEERVLNLARAIADLLQDTILTQPASILGTLVFSVFAMASMAQLLIGYLLDRVGARPAIAIVTSVQLIFFLIMPGQTGLVAYAVALGFMLGVFGQVPINDFLIGTTATGRFRARAFGVRYLVTFAALSAAIPLISIIHNKWGFDRLFLVLALLSGIILITSRLFLVKPQPRQNTPNSQIHSSEATDTPLAAERTN